MNVLGVEVGSASCQQMVEALDMFVASRTWRVDSVTRLTAVLTVMGASEALNVIAREVAEHIPGVGNVTSSAASRTQMARFSELVATQAPIVARPRSWYRTLECIDGRLQQTGMSWVPSLRS